MKKILFIVNVDWFFCSHRLPIAIAALKSGYEVHIATRVTNRYTELESYGFVVHPLNINRGKVGLTNEFVTLWGIVKTLKKIKPDLLHLITIKPVLYGGLAAHFFKVKGIVVAISGLGYVFTAEGVVANVRRYLIGGLYFLALKHRKIKMIFQNLDDRKILSEAAKLNSSSAVMIPGSGVDLKKFSFTDEPRGERIVLMASRILRDKGVVEFVEAAVKVRQRFGNVTFKLIGSIDPDNPASVTTDQVATWEGEGSIQILGHRDDIAEQISLSHLVVLPSYREGFPKVLIEAAACGRAVVTTDVPGCRDAITPGKTGLLVPVRDTSALAAAIERLLEDNELRRQMGQAGRKLAEERYSIEHVVDKHMAIYSELLAAK